MLPISRTEAERLATDVADVDIIFSRAFGVGPTFDITNSETTGTYIEARTGGDTTAPTESLLGPYEIYVVNTRDYVIELAAAETEVPVGQWRYIAAGTEDWETGQIVQPPLDEGRVLRVPDILAANTYRRFTVRSVHFDGKHTVGIVDLL